MKAWVVRLVLALSLASLAGCANLSAVQEFGKLSADAAGYTKLTDEYASSPKRNAQFTFRGEADKRQEMQRLAENRGKDVAALRLFQAAVAGYMDAVADLAADDAVAFDDEIGALADAAAKNNVIADGDANAVKAIGAAVASAVTDVYRQRKLRDLVGQADPPLQRVLAAMREIVGRRYEASLEVERQFVRSYYQHLETTARAERQAAFAERVWSEGEAKQSAFDERIAAVHSYDATLEAIAQAHHALYVGREKVDAAEVQKQLRQYVKKIRAAYKAARGEADGDAPSQPAATAANP